MPGRTSVVFVACLLGLLSCSLNRGPVAYEFPEAESSDGLTWGMPVPHSCNGDPVISRLVQGEEEVGVEVTTTVGGPDCQDGISFTLDEPLGDRTLRDLVSGKEFIVCGTVAPGKQAGGDVPCR